MQEFSRSLPMMLYAALDAVLPRFRVIFKDFGLTEQQWRVLRVLWERQSMGFGELASLTYISPPSLVGVVDRLRGMGLVDKARSADDRRAVEVTLTAAGQNLEQQVMPRVDEAYRELQHSVDSATWRSLLKGLEKVAAVPSGKAVV